MDEIKKYFGKNLKKLRRSKGHSQESLAEEIGINRRQLTRIETGKSFPSVGTLDGICYSLNISPSTLFDFSDYVESYKTGTDDEICYIAHKRNDNVILLREKAPETIQFSDTEYQQKSIKIKDEDGMFELAKKMKQKIQVEYYNEDILLKKVVYSPDGTSIIDGEVNQNDNILKEISKQLKDCKTSLQKLKFIELAIQCLEDKSKIEKLQNILEGMLL